MTGRENVTDDGIAHSGESPAVLSVVSGSPSEEELAALTAVVVVALQGDAEAENTPDQAQPWVRRAMLRLGPTPGPGSWRRSVR